MARIRSIKPEFWTSEQIVDCSAIARLMFIGLWNFCDDAGIHPASERRIKMSIFPGDDIDAANIRRLINELSSSGLIELYEVEGVEYLIVTGWATHQKIERPSFKYPKPPKDRRKVDKSSSNDRRSIVAPHPPEGSGEERIGKEESNINNTAVPDTARTPKGDAAAEGLHPRYREVTERVAKLLDNPNLLVFGQVDGWLKAGADPEADIYPTLLRLKAEWRSGSLKFFSKAIAEALASRATLDVSGAVTIAPPDPNADLAESDRRWISRLQGFDQRGFWLEDDWGPKPGDTGHRCPTWLTERYRQQKQRAA